MSLERRQFVRLGFDAPAQLTTIEHRLDTKVVDLSFKGALLRVPPNAKLEVGAPCLLNVRLTQTDASIVMSAEVASVCDDLVGLVCRSIDIDSVTHLRRLIEVNLGDPKLLVRELIALGSASAPGAAAA